MATKEDILEQIVEEYLIHEGYFVQHNIKYRPCKDHKDFDSEKDSNHSDIDVIGLHPFKCGERKVMVVSCKSWQNGFSPKSYINAIEQNEEKKWNGRPVWKCFRELTVNKWSDAYIKKVQNVTGEERFTHVTAVTLLKGAQNGKISWENYKPFRCALRGNSLKVLTLSDMVEKILPHLTTTLAGTDIGRTLQLLKAAKIDLSGGK